MRKDIKNEILKYGLEANIMNKSELARRLGCSRHTVVYDNLKTVQKLPKN